MTHREFHIGETTILYRVEYSRRARKKRLEVAPTEVVVIAPEATAIEGDGGVELCDLQEMWGLCGKDRVLRIGWRLIQAPKLAMEYVCAHEVCHLVHRHHDQPFWDLLSDVMPNWREGMARLEEWERSTFEWSRAL